MMSSNQIPNVQNIYIPPTSNTPSSYSQLTAPSMGSSQQFHTPVPSTVSTNSAPWEENTRRLSQADLPSDCRLFLGNLASERTSKREIYDVFSPYGSILEILIKDSYGFVQYDNPDSCQRAIQAENGRTLGGMTLDVKLSNSKSKKKRGGAKKKERTAALAPVRRGMDSYRRRDARRSRSPNSWHRNDRDRYRDRSRSRSRSYSRSRSRSPYSERDSKQVRDKDSDSSRFPLPRRFGKQVPQCQLLVLEESDRRLIWQIEQSFKSSGITFDTIFLSPRLPLRLVVNQMEIEGVTAVLFLEHRHQLSKKVSLQVFSRDSSHKHSIYEDIEIDQAVKYVSVELQAKSSSSLSTSISTNSHMPAIPNSSITGSSSLNIDFNALAQIMNNIQQPKLGSIPTMQTSSKESVSSAFISNSSYPQVNSSTFQTSTLPTSSTNFSQLLQMLQGNSATAVNSNSPNTSSAIGWPNSNPVSNLMPPPSSMVGMNSMYNSSTYPANSMSQNGVSKNSVSSLEQGNTSQVSDILSKLQTLQDHVPGAALGMFHTPNPSVGVNYGYPQAASQMSSSMVEPFNRGSSHRSGHPPPCSFSETNSAPSGNSSSFSSWCSQAFGSNVPYPIVSLSGNVGSMNSSTLPSSSVPSSDSFQKQNGSIYPSTSQF